MVERRECNLGSGRGLVMEKKGGILWIIEVV